MAGELLDELAEKAAEIVAVVGRTPDELASIDPAG